MSHTGSPTPSPSSWILICCPEPRTAQALLTVLLVLDPSTLILPSHQFQGWPIPPWPSPTGLSSTPALPLALPDWILLSCIRGCGFTVLPSSSAPSSCPPPHTHRVRIHSETLPLLLTVPLLRPLQASHSLSLWAFFFSNLSLGSPFRELSNFVYFPPGLPFLQSEPPPPPPPPALTSLIPPCLPTAVQPLPDYS